MRTCALRLARADLLARPGQTALTAIAVFTAATALVVTLALRSGLDDPFARAKRDTRGSDVAVFGDLSDADVATLSHLPGVAAVDVRARTRTVTPLARASVDVGLEGLPAGGLDVPHVTDGRRPAARGEVLVERSFARESGLRVGQRLDLSGRRYTIAG